MKRKRRKKVNIRHYKLFHEYKGVIISRNNNGRHSFTARGLEYVDIKSIKECKNLISDLIYPCTR